MDLILPLKGVYFDQIRDGTKTEEYRLLNDYWHKWIEGRHYDRVIITRGYSKKGDVERTIERPWRGFTKKNDYP